MSAAAPGRTRTADEQHRDHQEVDREYASREAAASCSAATREGRRPERRARCESSSRACSIARIGPSRRHTCGIGSRRSPTRRVRLRGACRRRRWSTLDSGPCRAIAPRTQTGDRVGGSPDRSGFYGAHRVCRHAPRERIEATQQTIVSTTIAPASVPVSPSAPNIPRSLLLGLLAGLCLGTGLAFARHALDTRVRSDTDIEPLSDSPILAALPTVRTGGSGLAVRTHTAPTPRRYGDCARTCSSWTSPPGRTRSWSPRPCREKERRPRRSTWRWP